MWGYFKLVEIHILFLTSKWLEEAGSVLESFLEKKKVRLVFCQGETNFVIFLPLKTSLCMISWKKNNLLSDCIFYLTLGLLIFYLLNLYYFHTFSSFLLQPAPFPCALIEAPYKKISSEHWDWRCNEITQKAEQLAQITRLQLFPHFQPWFAHLLAVEIVFDRYENIFWQFLVVALITSCCACMRQRTFKS